MQCHSLAVGHRKKMWRDCLSQIVQCNSLAGKRMWWDHLHKIYNVTHILLVIGKDVMRLIFMRCAMSLTTCWLKENRSWDCPLQHVQYHSQAIQVGYRKRCHDTSFHKLCDSDEKRGDNSAGTLRESSSHLSMIVLKTQLSGCKRKRSYCPIYGTGQAYIPRVCKYM